LRWSFQTLRHRLYGRSWDTTRPGRIASLGYLHRNIEINSFRHCAKRLRDLQERLSILTSNVRGVDNGEPLFEPQAFP